jgi:hypothetical protein
MPERCDACKFFNLYFEDDDDGECRRYAPGSKEGYARWPSVDRDNWCGEYKSKGEGHG